MGVNARGCLTFIGIVVFAGLFCAWIPFVFLPQNGIAVSLPVILVPGETVIKDFFGKGNPLTNTIIGTALADIIVVLLALFAFRASKGWRQEVPGRFQSFMELLGGFMYDFSKNFAGVKPIVKNWLFPLAASFFIFLLVANWLKLIPGVETVGTMHCAEPGFASYPITPLSGGYQLFNNRPLNAGDPATEDTYKACKAFEEDKSLHPSAEELHEIAAAYEPRIEALEEERTEANAAEIDAEIEALKTEMTQSAYVGATMVLTPAELEAHVEPYHFAVTPWVRAAATDLNVTLGLALVAFTAIQVFGVAAQGPNYFQKFVNLRALGNLGKKPLGAIDFVVGLLEIISEIGKIVSLTFRLFGNLFAGSVLLAVMTFLVATMLPIVFYGLEMIVVTIQAFVFAVLTLVFSAQAMESHHGDEHDDHGDEHATA